ncbi:porin family protein [Dysgonomonas sp. Marseille-P4677]|uniref:outer membrane beta-barrel protein n=1 Tax=Dysgonomonas sp. Marseille-P4677 TaxID=2364790 RepID=UPI0019146C2C|nr:outer membrane beta-barrel protein [Dysgonomonas sp. Marseille-P4677]MBK5720474.1 porin family protein [Dysgonomonas sp. Marseille-P4677]
MRTKYLLLLGLSLLLFSINTSAQIRFGVKGGIDVVNNKLDLNILKTSNRLGYQIGPSVEFIVPASGFGGEVSVLYGRKEYKIEDKTADATISDYDYISIPVNIKQRIGLGPVFGVFFTGGAYGNVKVNGGSIKVKDVINEYKSKNFILGLGAGAGVTVLRRIDVGLYFRGDLTKNYGDEYMDAGIFQNKKNQTWTVGLNYYF